MLNKVLLKTFFSLYEGVTLNVGDKLYWRKLKIIYLENSKFENFL